MRTRHTSSRRLTPAAPPAPTADPTTIPGLDVLQRLAATVTAADVETGRGFLLDATAGHGCSGTTDTVTFFDVHPWTIDAWEQHVDDADARARAAIDADRADVRARHGSAPVWNASWPGTRGEYDAALCAWQDATRVIDDRWSRLVETLTGDDRQPVTPAGYVAVVNDGNAYDPGRLLALAAHLEFGCRCMCSSAWVDDADDVRESLGLAPGAAWPVPSGGADPWLSPPATIATLPGGARLLVSGHVTGGDVVARLRGALDVFDARLVTAVTERRTEMAAFDALYDDARLDGCRFAEYEEHKNDPAVRRNQTYRLSQPVSSIRILEGAFSDAGLTGLDVDALPAWLAALAATSGGSAAG